MIITVFFGGGRGLGGVASVLLLRPRKNEADDDIEGQAGEDSVAAGQPGTEGWVDSAIADRSRVDWVEVGGCRRGAILFTGYVRRDLYVEK